jgi:hypothetical protein
VADATGENYLLSYVVILIAVLYIVWYALMGSKPAKTE